MGLLVPEKLSDQIGLQTVLDPDDGGINLRLATREGMAATKPGTSPPDDIWPSRLMVAFGRDIEMGPAAKRQD
jgi:hypothetical protein